MKFVVAALLLASIALASNASVDDQMRVFVKTLTGKTFTIESKPTETIGDLKLKIQDKEGVPVDEQHLVYAGGRLVEGKTLAEYKIVGDSTLRLAGGERGPQVSNLNSITSSFLEDDQSREQRQVKEISEERFRELFGESARIENPQDTNAPQRRSFFNEFRNRFTQVARHATTIAGAINWLMNLFPRGP